MADDEHEDSEMMIEAPPGLLPNLHEWGIEEVEVGICEDSYENRRAIRENKGSWVSVFDQYGHPTGNLQVITSEMKNDALRYRKSMILEDPSDVNSDYITGLNLLLTDDVDKIAPTWVIVRTRQFLHDEDERDALGGGPAAMVHPSRLVRAPSRCVARKADGSRCWFWNDGSLNRDSVCSRHTKKAPKEKVKPDLIQLARNRLISAAHGAVDEIESLMNNATSEQVRLGAAKEMLDRAGLRGGFEIDQKTEVTVTSPADLLAKRLADLAEKGRRRDEMMELVAERNREVEAGKTEDVQDAEIVESEATDER